MISVIVASVNENFLRQFSENIAESIGVEYELIHLDKAVNQYGLCHAYNEGAKRSRFPYLCFVHDDVQFLSKDWGKNIIAHFESDEQIGLLGVAGSVCKTKMVSMWHEGRLKGTSANRVNIVQHFRRSNAESTVFYDNPGEEMRSEVVVLDGVFMATRRAVWEACRFDEQLLHRYHAYDLDFCLRAGQRCRIYVVYDVLMEHFSEGYADIGFVEDYCRVHQKWKQHLPLLLKGYQWDRGLSYAQSWQLLKQTLNRLIGLGASYRQVFSRYVFLLSFMEPQQIPLRYLYDIIAVWLHISQRYLRHGKAGSHDQDV